MSARLQFLGVTGRPGRQGPRAGGRLVWLGQDDEEGTGQRWCGDFKCNFNESLDSCCARAIAFEAAQGAVQQFAGSAFCDVQKEINTRLVAQGFLPIETDCCKSGATKSCVGPITCGAAEAVGVDALEEPCAKVSERTPPTRAGGAPAPTPPPPVAESGGGGTLALILLAIGAAGFYAFTS